MTMMQIRRVLVRVIQAGVLVFMWMLTMDQDRRRLMHMIMMVIGVAVIMGVQQGFMLMVMGMVF